MSAHRRGERAPGRHRSRSGSSGTSGAPAPDEDPIALLREHRRSERDPWWKNLPRPSGGALVGVAALVLIALAAIHLTSQGTAVPLEADADGAAPQASAPAAAESSSAPPSPEPDDAPAADQEVVVHVSGAVKDPGLVHLPAGSRVADALEACGGTTAKADEAALNLARPLADGEHIHVPTPGEDVPDQDEDQAQEQAPSTDPGDGSGPEAGTEVGDPVDLNTADASALETLPGIGPSIAQRILDHRELNGPFAGVDDLLEVSGIGPATLEKIRPLATV
jgi:competence protein ComEA